MMEEGGEVMGRPIRLRLWGATDVGRVRKENQDAFFAAEFPTPGAQGPIVILGPEAHPPAGEDDPSFALGPRGAVLVVSDGMGGPAGGARASRLALESVVAGLERSWLEGHVTTPEHFIRAIRSAVEGANADVHRASLDSPDLHGMGATMTLAGVLDDTLILAQVGDSRGYLFRDGTLVQVTRDQSLVQDLVDRGALTPEAAARSPHRNVIMQALGPEPDIHAVLGFQRLRRGDLLLLCSDGLSGAVNDWTLEAILGQDDQSLRARTRSLVEAALEAGGEDNITVLLCAFEGEGLRPVTPGELPSPRVIPPDPG